MVNCCTHAEWTNTILLHADWLNMSPAALDLQIVLTSSFVCLLIAMQLTRVWTSMTNQRNSSPRNSGHSVYVSDKGMQMLFMTSEAKQHKGNLSCLKLLRTFCYEIGKQYVGFPNFNELETRHDASGTKQSTWNHRFNFSRTTCKNSNISIFYSASMILAFISVFVTMPFEVCHVLFTSP